MRVSLLALLVSAIVAVMLSAPALAHHGTSGMDMSKLVTLKATIADFQFINPHSLVHFDVNGDDGNIEKWVAELGAANALYRDGWNKDTLKPGDQVTVSGYRAKNGTHNLRVYEFRLSDGTRLGRSDGR
jgi:hypothetical protein